jgi:predicted Zn-dependent protease
MLAAAILAGCQAAPVTGRNQLIVLPESQDSQLGLEAYQQILSESEVSNDSELNRRVKEVGRRIAAASPQPEWDWQFTVIENDEPNAFALPGGKVGVNTGLFQVAKNDDQLAAVMGHEVAHAMRIQSAICFARVSTRSATPRARSQSSSPMASTPTAKDSCSRSASHSCSTPSSAAPWSSTARP